MLNQLARVVQWLRQSENALFCVVIALHLIPIWAFEYFPSQDGPAHLNNANVLREYHLPDLTAFREYYSINSKLMPNWTTHLILAGLMSIVPQLIAEKILLTGYVVLFPVSIRYALRAVQLQAGALVFLCFPFVYNYTFHMGFYNFSYSLLMFLFVVGYWMRHQDCFTLQKTAVLSFLALGLYFSHIVSLGIAWIAITSMVAWFTFLDVRGAAAVRAAWHEPRALWSLWALLRRRALFPLCAFLPALTLAVVFVGEHGSAPLKYLPVDSRWKGLLVLRSLYSFDAREIWFSKATVVLFAGIATFLIAVKIFQRRWDRWDAWLGLAGLFGILYLMMPDEISGGGFLSARLMLFPFFAALLWFGAQAIPRFVRFGSQCLAVVIALGFLVLHFQSYSKMNRYLDEYLSGSHMLARNSTLLALPFEHQAFAPDGRTVSGRIQLFLNASGYLAADRRLVDLVNYEARTGYFPIDFRPEMNPVHHIALDEGFGGQPPRVSFADYSERTGGRVDHVAVWRTQDRATDPEAAELIFEQLEAGYDLLFTSPQNGFMRLYRRKGWNPDLGMASAPQL